MFDRIAIGRRITQARLAQGINTSGQLVRAIEKLIADHPDLRIDDKTIKAPTRQAIDYWEAGKGIPSWQALALLTMVFKPEHNEEWLMFGERRTHQIQEEKTILARIDPEESRLVQIFRTADAEGKKNILASAVGIAGQNPAPEATLHPFNQGQSKSYIQS